MLQLTLGGAQRIPNLKLCLVYNAKLIIIVIMYYNLVKEAPLWHIPLWTQFPAKVQCKYAPMCSFPCKRSSNGWLTRTKLQILLFYVRLISNLSNLSLVSFMPRFSTKNDRAWLVIVITPTYIGPLAGCPGT